MYVTLKCTNLPWMRTSDFVDEVVVVAAFAKESLGSHSCADLGQHREVSGIVQSKCGNGCGKSGSIQDTEMLLSCQRDRGNIVFGKCIARRNNLASSEDRGPIKDSN